MIKELDYQTKAVDELVEKCAKLLQSGGERKKLTALLDGVAKMKLGDFKDNTIDAFGDACEYLMKMYASITGHDPLGREKLR